MGCVAGVAVATTEQEEVVARDPVAARKPSPNFHRQYLLEEKLGEGCFARVYACRRTGGEPETEFAVKITDLRKHQTDTQLRCERAQQEATLLKTIGSQNHCCRFIESMACRRFHYIVMEKCSMTLLQALEGMPGLTEQSLAGIVQQMFRGVAEVHALGMVHRDVKPDNFLCTGPDATVKLCDFGFAHLLPSGCEGIKGVYGTAPFMSPEMIVGSLYAMPTDVWSIGVILYAFLFGEFPYMPEKPSKELMRAAIASGVPEPSFVCAAPDVQLSSGAQDLLKMLLCRSPQRRPTMIEALRHSWFSTGTQQEPGSKWCSLKATLQSAERVGAFGSSSGTSAPGAQRLSSADRMLQELQKKYRWSEMHSSHEERDAFDRHISPKSPEEQLSARKGAFRVQHLGILIST